MTLPNFPAQHPAPAHSLSINPLSLPESTRRRQAQANQAVEAGFDPLIRASLVRAVIGGISNDTLIRWVRSGSFPPPIRVADNNNMWRKSAVLGWLYEKEQTRSSATAFVPAMKGKDSI